ncbi:MAG: M24 family metallopeptidase [SAR324 cluster bacterium]
MKAKVAPAGASQIARRLGALRERMAALRLDLYLVPSADEHQNEYLPPHKRRREAITGFAGSAGDAAIGRDEAHLFVDSRYHLEADRAVDPALFQVHKLGQAGVADWIGWLKAFEKRAGPLRAGYDPFVMSQRSAERVREALARQESEVVPIDGNLVDAVWDGRPAAPQAAVYALDDAVTGEPVADKLGRLRMEMQGRNAGVLVLSRLDDVAWATNLRGSDIPYNPVFEAYLVVERETVTLFTDRAVPAGVRAALGSQIRLRPYGELRPDLAEALGRLAGAPLAVWADREGTSAGVQRMLGGATMVQDAPNPAARLKALKNPVEIELSRAGHLKSGAAKVRSLSILQGWLAEGRKVSEKDYADLLAVEYAREEGFSDLSFGTIAAYGPNGAIVHYGTPDPEVWLQPGGMFLVDSGIQVLGATTDDTRTVAIGPPSEEQRRRFTDVLRAHIRLALQVFPEGTTGQMLDALARSPLWNSGADYGHGTGHGVGAFLNVHEGPQSISSRGTVPLEPGMIVSNEPGYYRAGWGGIRLENLYVVEEAMGLAPHPGGKRWLRLSPLTMIPFDLTLVDTGRLSGDEGEWLREYHGRVWERVEPRLAEPHRRWLRRACGLS